MWCLHAAHVPIWPSIDIIICVCALMCAMDGRMLYSHPYADASPVASRTASSPRALGMGPNLWICVYIYIYIYTHTEREREMYMYEHMISYYITPQTLYNKWFNIILWPVSHWGVHDQTPKSVPCAVKRDTAFPVSTSYASLQIFQIPHDPRLERQAHYVYVYYMHICM